MAGKRGRGRVNLLKGLNTIMGESRVFRKLIGGNPVLSIADSNHCQDSMHLRLCISRLGEESQ